MHVRRFCAKQFFHAVNRQLLSHVHKFAAAVVAFTRVAFGVFVGQLRTLRFHHRWAGVVFGRNQFDVVLLALIFLGNHRRDFGVDVGNGVGGAVEHEGSFIERGK